MEGASVLPKNTREENVTRRRAKAKMACVRGAETSTMIDLITTNTPRRNGNENSKRKNKLNRWSHMGPLRGSPVFFFKELSP